MSQQEREMKKLISLGRLVITYLALSALIIFPRNPRHHPLRQIKQIARSMEVFGFVVPLLVDRNNNIVSGHGRFLAAQSLGFTEAPVTVTEDGFEYAGTIYPSLTKIANKITAGHWSGPRFFGLPAAGRA
jgi:hypothetical protein